MSSMLSDDVFPWFHPSTIIVLSVVTVLIIVLWLLLPSSQNKQKNSKRKQKEHAVITGGSSGIGLALAHECVKQGFRNVTLIARDETKLQAAKKELMERVVDGTTGIHTYSFDVSNGTACQEYATAIINNAGPPTVLFNNAGTSSSAAFHETPLDEFSRLMAVNYLGAVYLTQALLPSMKQNHGGTICMTSSMAGLVGVYGYTAYSASKFALKGYCEALQMEVRRDGVNVMLAFPPDTDTPGYKLENESKPKETVAISEVAGLFPPETVAKAMVAAALSNNPPYCVYFGIEGWMLATLTAGMGPVHGIWDGLMQVLLMGLLRLISLVYLWDFTRIIRNCAKTENNIIKTKEE